MRQKPTLQSPLRTRQTRRTRYSLVGAASILLIALLFVGGGISARAGAPPTTGLPNTSGTSGTYLPSPATQERVLVIRAYFRDAAERNSLAVEFGAEEYHTLDGYLTFWGDTDLYNSLKARGLRVEIDEKATAEANTVFPDDNDPGTFYGGYRTVEEMEAFLDQKVSQYPTLAQKVDIGDSWCKTHPGACIAPAPTWNGYDLWTMRITNQAVPGPKPVFWYDAGIHSREIATPELAMRFIDYLLNNYQNNADARWLVDYHDIWVMPMLNPDGHHMVEANPSQPYSQRKNADRDDGCTTFPPSGGQLGTDLNRNFPFLWGCCGGSSGSACSETYRGPAAGSEEETQAVIAKIRQLIPDQRGPNNTDPAPLDTTGILQSMHSVANLNLYPWGWTNTDSPNHADLDNLAKHMSAVNAGPPGNGYQPCQPGECLYNVDGDSFDWQYGELGAPSFTTEISGGSFYPPYTQVDSIFNENRGMLLYMAKVARTPYLLTRGPDANSPVTNPMTVTQGSPVQLTATINYAWTGNRYLQNVSAAEYYVGTPPWAGGVAIPMQPTDGGFNSPTEAVQATIDTSSIPAGTHLIFVRGRGVNDYGGFGSWGPVSATFLTITGGGTATSTATGTPPTSTPTRTPTRTNTPSNTPLPTATTDPCNLQNYTVATGTGTVVPGTTNIGSSCDDCVTSITLPFPYQLYDQTFTAAGADSNGKLHFPTGASVFSNTCLPGAGMTYTIFPFWDDLRTDGTGCTGGCGIFTSVTGSAPNRIFNIEWRTTYFFATGTANFEVRLYEGQTRFDIVLGAISITTSATGGVQRNSTSFTQIFCNTTPANTLYTFTLPTCNTPTTGPSATRTNTVIVPPTSTNTVVVLPTSTGTGIIPTSTRTGTAIVPPTNTVVVPPTNTSVVPPTNTIPGPTNTPVTCNIEFTDVPPGATFYDEIRCLACRNIIDGYACGGVNPETGQAEPCNAQNWAYFRPNNRVIRGQIAKIVSNASGDNSAPGPQIYADVPTSQTFFAFINRLTNRGVMGGYPCGSPGEPCNAQNQPYFRPYNFATRGQIAQITARGANITDPVPAGTHSFTDVPINSTFYLPVERLRARGVMTGFPCGGVNPQTGAPEPCDVQNRPYFRVNNNATRGQTAQIVSRTFFPGCITPGR